MKRSELKRRTPLQPAPFRANGNGKPNLKNPHRNAENWYNRGTQKRSWPGELALPDRGSRACKGGVLNESEYTPTFRVGQPLRRKSKRTTEAQAIMTRAESRDCGYETPCFVWMACRSKKGYGIFSSKNDGTTIASRRVYELYHGVSLDPFGDEVHHLCENPPCVNPEHLQAMTKAEHAQTRRKLAVEITEAVIETVKAAPKGSKWSTCKELAALHGVTANTVRSLYYEHRAANGH